MLSGTSKQKAVWGPSSIAVALLVLSQVMIAAGPASAVALQINEIRIDQPDADVDEYFELSGDPEAALISLTYLVIGDGASAGDFGVIENVTTLSGAIPADGYFLAAETGSTLANADLSPSLNFENTDNVTHILVDSFVGALNQDLDTDDDGTLDITPWSAIVDSVAVIDNAAGDRLYSPSTVGPATGVAPFHVIRCGSSWNIGSSALSGGNDTPGAFNTTCDSTPPTTSIIFPLAGGEYRSSFFDSTCSDSTPDICGMAADENGGSGLSKVEVRIQRSSDGFFWNGTTWQETEIWELPTGTAPWSYGFDPAEGGYSLTVRATDVAGNTGTSSAAFVIDNTGPQTRITSGPRGTVYETSARFRFSSPGDLDATFRCYLDSQAFTTCESPINYTDLTLKSHTFKVRAIDPAGNVDSSPATRTWLLSAPKPKNVDLKTSQNPVPQGERVTLTATVSPCAGHKGDVVKFQKLLDEWETIATIETDNDCKARKGVRMNSKTTFRAVSPKQDDDHQAGTSERLTVRIQN